MRGNRLLLIFFFAFSLMACGGGGAPDTSIKVPTIALTLVDGAETLVPDRSLSASDSRYLKVVLRTKSGAAAAYTEVVITPSENVVALVPSSGKRLTDSNGVALIKILPADTSQAIGSLNLTASASVESVSLTAPFSVQFAGGGAIVTGSPSLDLTLVDGGGVQIQSKALSQTQPRYLKAVLKNKAGVAVPYTRVTVALDATDAVLVPSSGIGFTDESGVMLMKVSPASVSSSGGVIATATSSVESVAVTKTIDLQISSGTVSLADFQASSASVQRGQSLTVSVAVQVNGVVAPSNSVSVNFDSPCGTATPTSALVDNSGRASTVVQTSTAGTCSVTASAIGNAALTGSFQVTAPPITGLTFVSATPSVIYQSGSVGVNQSIVRFKVIDSNSSAVSGVKVAASLTNTNDGITFCGAPTEVVSDASGQVSFSICGGTLPATVQVKAALVNSPLIATVSNILTVQTGLPSQRFFGLASSQPNFYVGSYYTNQYSGNSTTISVYAADRLGNPVPENTKVVFVTSGGLITSDTGESSCLIAKDTGTCSVQLRGQAYRPLGSTSPGADPRPGRVTVLAYADGEETFYDANFNNRYDTGEKLDDLGRIYIDKDQNFAYDASYFTVQTGALEGDNALSMPTGSVGTQLCSATDIAANRGLSVEGTCNGVWDGYTKVRRSIVLVFSGDTIGQPASYDLSIPAAKRTQIVSATARSVTVQLADLSGNPLPSDTNLTVSTIPLVTGGSCVATLSDLIVGNSLEPTRHTATFDSCVSGDVISFTADHNGKKSSYGYTVP